MAAQLTELQDAAFSWSWPVRWSSAVRQATARGQHPDVLLDAPELVAHRILDRLAGKALEVHRGAPGASETLVDAIRTLAAAAPWLLSTERAAGQQHDSKVYKEPEEKSPDTVHTLPDDGLLDESGIIDLLACASSLAGRSGARTVLELAAAARAAERWLPTLGRVSDSGLQADMLLLGGVSPAGLHRKTTYRGSDRAEPDPNSATHPDTMLIAEINIWKWLNARTHNEARDAIAGPPDLHRCGELCAELIWQAETRRPTPSGPVTWTTGIQRVEVDSQGNDLPLLMIHGSGFASMRPPGVGVVTPYWNDAADTSIHRPATVESWSDTKVVVRLDAANVGGVAAFVDLRFLAQYDQWNKEESGDILGELSAQNCPTGNRRLLWSPYPASPAPDPAATFEVGLPRIVAKLTRDPIGLAPHTWDFSSAHFQTGEVVWVVWRTINATSAVLRPSNQAATEMLAASGLPASGVSGTRGEVRLVALANPAIVEFTIEATNAVSSAQTPLRMVITGPALGAATITVLQSLPGGDIDVVLDHHTELLSPNPFGGLSIPLVAEKRTVVRIDWWPAVPQVPEGVQFQAVAKLELHSHATSSGGTLRPGASTAEEPPVESVMLSSGRPFSSLAQYEQWVNDGNNPQTFNVVIPAQWCQGNTLLTATVTAFSPARTWTLSAVKWAKFHRRHRVRIRYRRHSTPSQPAPTTQQAEAALRIAASVLPIPDPEILVLGSDPTPQNGHLIEDMFAERGGAPTPAWRDEIWLVVGPRSVGGVAHPAVWPWIAATEVTAWVTPHEIGHLFGQNHLPFCNATQAPVDPPASFPQQGNVVVVGWDTWNNMPVRGAIDFMTYCNNGWSSPERWRRIFLLNRP